MSFLKMGFLKKVDDFLLALLVVVAVDAVLFHGGAYFPILQPDSFSGRVEQQAQRFARSLEASPGRNRIVVMGNSKTEACIRESQLERGLTGRGLSYHAINLATGGSSPRAWYVLLTDGRVTLDNTEIVVLGVDAETLREEEEGSGRPDLDIAKTRLRLRDSARLAKAYRGLEDRLEVFAGGVFRTLLFRDDVRQMLTSPTLRRSQVGKARERFEARMQSGARVDNHSKQNLQSARLGRDGKLVFDELDAFLRKREALRRWVERKLRRQRQKRRAMARSGRTTRKLPSEPGKIEMLGHLVDALNARGVHVVFSVTPISAYSLGRTPEVDHLANFFRDLEHRQADFAVWRDPALIRKIQAPAYYQDPLHVNQAGAKLYTRALVGFLAEHLSAPPSPSPSSELEI